jgi:hypothetical protein
MCRSQISEAISNKLDFGKVLRDFDKQSKKFVICGCKVNVSEENSLEDLVAGIISLKKKLLNEIAMEPLQISMDFERYSSFDLSCTQDIQHVKLYTDLQIRRSCVDLLTYDVTIDSEIRKKLVSLEKTIEDCTRCITRSLIAGYGNQKDLSSSIDIIIRNQVGFFLFFPNYRNYKFRPHGLDR